MESHFEISLVNNWFDGVMSSRKSALPVEWRIESSGVAFVLEVEGVIATVAGVLGVDIIVPSFDDGVGCDPIDILNSISHLSSRSVPYNSIQFNSNKSR